MIKRYVTHTGKDRNGDITKLCNPTSTWGPRYKADAIRDIESGAISYWVPWKHYPETEVKVVPDIHKGKYLRTDRDATTKNNLDDLPDC